MDIFVETDESLVTPEMLRDMVSDEMTDPDIPNQEAEFFPENGEGVMNGDR